MISSNRLASNGALTKLMSSALNGGSISNSIDTAFSRHGSLPMHSKSTRAIVSGKLNNGHDLNINQS